VPLAYVLVDTRTQRLIPAMNTDRAWSSPSLAAAIANGEAWGGLAIPADVWRAVAARVAAGELVIAKKNGTHEGIISPP